ncbi:Polysaccharide biosynthesis protein [Reichenbachiella faecimaris]|uniref:Polysaccharide biosynthesis protein n=1 Tax=Reichenbachiella faecimaris TaxID=692418 RepID=A0A1W2GIM0_REIFA|nr:polysaccharide biosynthesis protein [Reichenbachiella faecimaris]SMD36497.1 Polysaccharide biosynthesis protein [Reichenbachiella faecimaris]
MLNNQSIFITGGTGTLGQAFIKKALTEFPKIKEITIYSRDEMKQYDLRREYPSGSFPRMNWVIGDIRDAERLNDKMKKTDIVIHAAAMKHIPICEENPEECLKTNVEGTKNVIHAAIENKVKKIVLASTDKAVDPISIYGNSKQAAEKLFLNASNEVSKFAIVRLGNIWGSRGSVVPLFKELAKTGIIPITHPDMTRFFCTEDQSADAVHYTLKNMKGGEIIIPKMKARKISDLAKELAPECAYKIIGLRGFEKIGEKLASDIELERLHESKHFWMINKTVPSKDAPCISHQLDSSLLLKYQLN